VKSTAARLRLYIDTEQADRTHEEIAAIGVRAQNAKPVMFQIQALMAASGREQFESEGSSVGEPWEHDTPSWAERKAAKGLSDKTLVRHGKLRDAMMAYTSGKGAIRRLSAHSATVGVRLYYARFAGKKRRLLTMTEAQQDKYASMMISWILDGRTDGRVAEDILYGGL